jgi:hypothetical protein
VINHTEQSQRVSLPGGGRDLLRNAEAGDVLQLDPYGVAVIKLD